MISYHIVPLDDYMHMHDYLHILHVDWIISERTEGICPLEIDFFSTEPKSQLVEFHSSFFIMLALPQPIPSKRRT